MLMDNSGLGYRGAVAGVSNTTRVQSRSERLVPVSAFYQVPGCFYGRRRSFRSV